jgi:autotransporter-associated beta strand protein
MAGINVATTASNGLTINNALVGGALTKSGVGKLILTGDNIFNGGTTISAGTLQIGTSTLNASITMISSTMARWRWPPRTTGPTPGRSPAPHGITSIASGTITFTGNSSYSGGTTLSSGGGTFRYLGQRSVPARPR